VGDAAPASVPAPRAQGASGSPGGASLAGKAVIVTGAGRGIGRAIGEACLAAGATVGLNVRSENAAAALAPLAEAHVGRAHVLRFDVRDAAALEAEVARFRAAAGGIDGLVNNAGVVREALLLSASVDELRETLETDLMGPLLCARAVLPAMLERRGGAIVNVGSVAASRPSRGQVAYAAAKGGLEAVTRALAVEVGRKGIRVACIRAGPIETEMLAATRARAGDEEVLARVPLRRLGRPEEVAALAVYLLSDAAAYVTGSVVALDGGYGL
jgi:3-oxoacyl-[acyl-carrier protein] reductase